jgi:hypothetical protein
LNQQKLKEIFDNHNDKFDAIKENIEKDIIKEEYYKGMFYELFPFHYQRMGFTQGKAIKNLGSIKSTKDLCIYGFNNNGKIIEIKEGIDIANEFYYQFLFYENKFVKTFYFDNGKTLQNVSCYMLDKNDNIRTMYLKGRRGGREELYCYNTRNILEKIIIKQFDRNGNEATSLQHIFEYSNEELKNIRKIFDNGDSEIIYPPK